MSESMWGYLFILLGLIAAVLLLFFGTVNTENEQDYYGLKEVTQNAMLDSVDNVAYHVGLTQDEVTNNPTIHCNSGVSGTVRIITEKFVENFARRYAEIAQDNWEYTIKIYDIQECPPKVSLTVESKENYSALRRAFRGSRNGDDDETKIITNKLTAILETIPKD